MAKTIMVVDDEQDIIYSIKYGLEDIGAKYNIVGVNDGRECLKKIDQVKPDLILLDIMMPTMSGWEVCSKIKSNDKTKDIPVIFLTAKIDAISKSMGLKGAEDYIEKPVRPQDLLAAVEKALRRTTS